MLKKTNQLAKFLIVSTTILVGVTLNGAFLSSKPLESLGHMKSFSLPSLNGNGSISSESLKEKVVLIDFWASWCIPCKASFPAYNTLYKKYKDKGFEIIGINIDDNKDKALEFLSNNPAEFTILSDAEKKTAESYGLPTMPVSYLIDRSGNIVYVNKGFHEEDISKIEEKIKDVL